MGEGDCYDVFDGWYSNEKVECLFCCVVEYFVYEEGIDSDVMGCDFIRGGGCEVGYVDEYVYGFV